MPRVPVRCCGMSPIARLVLAATAALPLAALAQGEGPPAPSVRLRTVEVGVPEPAEIRLGDTLLGIADEHRPLFVQLPEGMVELSMTPLAGGERRVARFDVRATDTMKMAFVRKRTCRVLGEGRLGRVSLQTDEPAAIYASGLRVGETPIFELTLPAGCVELEVRPLDGGPRRTIKLEVAEGRSQRFAEGPLGVPELRAPTREACRHNPFVKQAHDALENLDLPRASQHLQRAITTPESCQEDVASTHLLSGFTAALQGETERAAQALRIALQLGVDPRVLENAPAAVKAARAEALRTPTFLTFTQLGAEAEGDVLRVTVGLTDPLHVSAQVGVYFRASPSAPWALLRVPHLTLTTRATVEVPLLEADEAEYFVVLMDRHSGWLATAGTPQAPHRMDE